MNIMNLTNLINHINHITNYEHEIYNNKISLNNNSYYNLYHGIFNFRKNEHIPLSQQTDATNNIIETNTQSTYYIGNSNCYIESNPLDKSKLFMDT